MNPLSPQEAWDAAEEQIELWREDRELAKKKRWKAINGY
jgi:hypothetical protein